MARAPEGGGYPSALRAAAVIVPAALLTALILFRYLVLDEVVDRTEAAIITILIGVTGVSRRSSTSRESSPTRSTQRSGSSA